MGILKRSEEKTVAVMNSPETLFQNPTSFEILQLSPCETERECPNEPAINTKLSDPDGFNYVVREKDLGASAYKYG